MPPTADDKIILDGLLGLETNVSQHSGDEKSFRVFRDLVTDVGRRIVKRDGRGPTLGSVAGTEVQSIHEYTYTDPTTGVESYHTLGAIDGGFYIYRWDGATTWTGQTLPITPTAGGRWGFCNAANSVFAFNGKDALLIGVQTAPNTITWRIAGIDAPSFAPTYSLTANDPPYTTGTVTGIQGTPHIRSTVGANWSNVTMPGHRIGVNGSIYTINTVDVFGGGGVSQVLTLTEHIKEDTPPVWTALTVHNKTDMVQPTLPNGLLYECTSAGGTTGGAEPAWPTIIGNTVVDGGVTWTCRAGWSYAILMGAGDWNDIAPQYRFSYYNPTTAHVSNPSPVLQVTETNQQGKTITITIPASAENQAAYLNGYTQIQLFRTPANAGICVALNEKLANVNSAVATVTYIETLTKFRDTYLTDFQAPLLNYKPPAGISAMVFQQGRGWAVHKPSGRVAFTPMRVELDFGRAIESWPPLYRLDLESAPRGLVVVGSDSETDSLVIQTSGRCFSVTGYNSVTFNPYGLKTRRSGSYLGAATDVDGNFVAFYADNRMMVMRDDIGQRIQDKLNLVKPSLIDRVRVHWFSANSRNYILLSIPKNSSSTANDYTYVFDLDLPGGPIYEWNFGISAFATVHDASTGALQLFGGDAAGAAYRLFSGVHTDVAANFAPTLLTALFRGDELRGDIKYVKLFVNDAQVTSAPTTAWTGVLYINEQTSPTATDGTATALTFRQLPYQSQSAQGRELIATFTSSIRTRSKVFQVAITFPNVDAALWIEQIVIGTDIDQLATNVGQPGNQA